MIAACKPGKSDQQRAACGRSRAAKEQNHQLVLRGHAGALAELSPEGIVEKWLYVVICSVTGLCWWRKV